MFINAEAKMWYRLFDFTLEQKPSFLGWISVSIMCSVLIPGEWHRETKGALIFYPGILYLWENLGTRELWNGH